MSGPYKFALQKNNKTCVLVKLSARFQQDGKYVDVPSDAAVTGDCDSKIALTFDNNSLSIAFEKNG